MIPIPSERRAGLRGGAAAISAGQLVRQRSNYDFGVARVASLANGLAETVRPSGERQQRSVTELEPAVLAPSMVLTLADRPERVQIQSIRTQSKTGTGLRTLVVENVTSGESSEISEELIVDVHPADAPVERLLQLDHRGRHTMLAREGFLHAHLEAQGNCRGLETLAGARIDLLPHQLRAAQRVLSLPAPRALLGDEVGLGKTIECGMVLSVLFRHNPALRVLVLCPGQLCLEWLGELYSRFHARIFALADSHERPQPLAELPAPRQSRLIASFGSLSFGQQAEALQKAVREQPWDVVIVDDAHRIPQGSPLFALVRELAAKAPGLLLLAATPTRARPAESARLIALLDAAHPPKDPQKFEKLRPFQQSLAELALATEKATPQTLPTLAERWLELLKEDERVRTFAADLGKKGARARAARGHLLRHVAEWYGTDSRILRSRRDRLGGELKLPARTFTDLTYEPSEPESQVAALVMAWCEALTQSSASPRAAAIGRFLAAQALQLLASGSAALGWLVAERRKGLGSTGAREPLSAASESASDLPLSQPETRRLLTQACRQLPVQPNEKVLLQELDEPILHWQKDEQRLYTICRWIGAQLEKEPRAKLLVFVEQPETLQTLQLQLAAELSRRRLRVAGLHVGMSVKERERAAHNFTHSETTAVLLCDQLGGEGRSFQAASWVVHVDLPWDLGAIEQRIGRLDRMGREQATRILSISSTHPVESSWSQLVWQHAELGTRSLAGLQFLAEELQREMVANATAGRASLLTGWLAKVRARIMDERQRQSEEQDPDQIFDRQRFDAEEAQELIDELVVDSVVGFPPLGDWAKKTGIVLKSTREPDIYDVDVGGQTRPVLDLRTETLRCTTDRRLAIGDPSLQFLSWGHPLVEALLHDAQSYSAARCTHVVHEDLEGRTWRGCRVRVLVQANPAHLLGLPAALQGQVSYIAQQMEETVFVRADGGIEPVAKQKEWLERAFAKSHNPDLLALAADERLYRQFKSDVETAAKAGLDHVRSKLVPIFIEPAEELAEDPDFQACLARQAVKDKRLSDEPRQLAAQLAALYEKALASIRDPLVTLDNIAFLDVYPHQSALAKS